MPEITNIQLPPLPQESARAYAARVAYCTMGAGRSLQAVGQELGKSRALMERWSSRYDWTQHARAWDATLASVQAQQAAAAYLAMVEEHRERYQQTGRALHAIAAKLLKRLDREIDTMPITPATLTIAAKAIMAAADLEAHALRIGELLATLDQAPQRADIFLNHQGETAHKTPF